MSDAVKGGIHRTMLGLGPKELSRGMRVAVTLDDPADAVVWNLVEEGEQAVLTTVQAIWVENYDSITTLTIVVDGGFPQTLKIPAQSAAMLPIIAAQNMKFTVSGASDAGGNGVTIPMIVLNSPQPYFVITIV